MDVRELLLEEYVEQSEEQILFNRYISLYRIFVNLIKMRIFNAGTETENSGINIGFGIS